jgi:hypothetical protein
VEGVILTRIASVFALQSRVSLQIDTRLPFDGKCHPRAPLTCAPAIDRSIDSYDSRQSRITNSHEFLNLEAFTKFFLLDNIIFYYSFFIIFTTNNK